MVDQKVYFKNSEGLTLVGILSTPKKETDRCIILCHGLASDKDEGGVYVDLSRELVERDFAVFRFDFRAHGESEGDSIDLTITGETSDIAAALEYVQSQGYGEVGLIAQSFGAGPALLYAGKHPSFFKAIVIWNGQIEYESLLDTRKTTSLWAKEFWGEKALVSIQQKGYAEIGPVKKFKIGQPLIDDMKRFNPWQELDRIESPILFIHGTKDTFIPYEDAVKITKMFDLPLVTIEGAEHGFDDDYAHELQATHATIDFLLENLWKH